MPSQASSSPTKLVRGTVLLVDDEQAILRAYGRILREAGYFVDELADGGAVTSALAAKDFDLIICDIGLPGMNGIDVLRAVRARDPDLPVVLITAGGDLVSALKAIEHGALRYLIKPVNPLVLSKTADDAMRFRQIARAKRQAFELYGSIANQASDLTRLAERFVRALESLDLAFQPIVRWSTQEVFGYEALLRTGEASLRNPNDFLAAAEQLQRIHDVGRLVRSRAADALRAADGSVTMFVNLHLRDLEDADLMSPTAPLSLVAERVVLEVTERASLEGGDVRARLATLRQLGFRLALDDLGAGYAGLASLVQLQPNIVKLDTSLIRGMERDSTKQRLVETMIGLCGELGMRAIAEGVETSLERDTLVRLGCDLLQGYLFAKPAIGFPVVDWGCPPIQENLL